jgi:hypothetical protein
MIEMRVVEYGLGMRSEIQYRYHIFTTDASGGLCPPNSNNIWSDWQTAKYVSLMETEINT